MDTPQSKSAHLIGRAIAELGRELASLDYQHREGRALVQQAIGMLDAAGYAVDAVVGALQTARRIDRAEAGIEEMSR